MSIYIHTLNIISKYQFVWILKLSTHSLICVRGVVVVLGGTVSYGLSETKLSKERPHVDADKCTWSAKEPRNIYSHLPDEFLSAVEKQTLQMLQIGERAEQIKNMKENDSEIIINVESLKAIDFVDPFHCLYLRTSLHPQDAYLIVLICSPNGRLMRHLHLQSALCSHPHKFPFDNLGPEKETNMAIILFCCCNCDNFCGLECRK